MQKITGSVTVDTSKGKQECRAGELMETWALAVVTV